LLSPLVLALPPGGRGQPWGDACGCPAPDCPGCPEPLDPGAPPGDGCGGNGDSLPLPGLPELEPGFVLGLPPELEGDELGDDAGGGDELGGCGIEVEEVAQPARTAAQAAVNTSRAMSG
jgi:hypothetical protein